MRVCSSIFVCLAIAVLVLGSIVACSKVDNETVTRAEDAIEKELRGKGLWERGNLPDDPAPEPDQIKGYYDIVEGAYRHVVNEGRVDRELAAVIGAGDVVSLFFDARIYGSSFENSDTFFTNIESRREQLAGGNSEFDTDFWPVEALIITLPDDDGILKPLQRALVGCREGDQVRVYLTPDLAFGAKTVYNIPRGETVVFEVTDLAVVD